jgi:hypothetical protein
MSSELLQPEICYRNYVNTDVNSNFDLTLTPTNNWYQDDKKYLYDDYSGDTKNNTFYKVLHTTGANDDTTEVTIEIDFKSDIYVDTIKLLNTNAEACEIKIREGSTESWTTIYTTTTNDENSIHWFATDYLPSYGTDFDYLYTEDGRLITTEDNQPIEVEYFNSCRYVQINITATQLTDDEKYIGELYIGQRYFKPSSAKVIFSKENGTDPRRIDLKNYEGYDDITRQANIYRNETTYKGLDANEFDLLTPIIKYGGVFNYFPQGSSDHSAYDDSIKLNDVYLVSSSGTFNYLALGRNNPGTLTLYLKETKIAS